MSSCSTSISSDQSEKFSICTSNMPQKPDSTSVSILRETAYHRLDLLVWEMSQSESGLEMKTQKSFFSSIQNACTGRELFQWLQLKLDTETEGEAQNVANMLCRLGFIVPVTEKQLVIRPDTCFRIQLPSLWTSRKWDSCSEEYAVYLLKKEIKGKSLESYEQTAISKLEHMFSNRWSELKGLAKDSVKKYNKSSKVDKEIEDSQDKTFWKVHRPPPGQKQHHYRPVDGFTRTSLCLSAINQNKKAEMLKTKMSFMKSSLERARIQSESVCDKTINVLVQHSANYSEHDPMITKQVITNPWIAIDEFFYEDSMEVEDKQHTKLELESWALGFRELLKDSYGKELFYAFLEQEYSQENLKFWDACEDLKQCPQSKVAIKVDRIKRAFLQSSSSHEVNLDRMVLEMTLKDLETPTRYSLDVAQQKIFNLMKDDCYPRFLKSDIYKQLLSDIRNSKRSHSSYLKGLQSIGRRTLSVGSRRSLSPCRRKPLAQSRELYPPIKPSSNTLSPFPFRQIKAAFPANSRFSPKVQRCDDGILLKKAGSLSSLILGNRNTDSQTT